MKISSVRYLCLLFVVWWSSALLADSQVEKLFYAVNKSNVEQVELLLEKGVDVNASLEGRGSKFYAIMLVRDVEVARVLLAAGANVNITDPKNKMNALHWVIYRTCDADVAEVLIKEGGADPNATTPVHPDYGLSTPEHLLPVTPVDMALMTCVAEGDLIEMLLKYGGDGKYYREIIENK